MKKFLLAVLLIILIFLFASCAAAPVRPGVAAYSVGDPGASKVTPRWSAMLSAEESDIFRIIPGGRMLVGTQDLGGSFFWAPSENDIALFDPSDGKMLWKVDRKGSLKGISDVLLVSPVIVLNTASGYTALSPDNGAVLWNWKPDGGLKYVTVGPKGIVFWRNEGSGLSKFTARSLQTGTETWAMDVKGVAAKDRPTNVSNWGEKIFITNEDIVLLDASDGTVRWQVKSPVGHVETTIPSEKHVAVFGSGGLALLDCTNGKILWKVEAAPIATIASIQDGMVVTASPVGKEDARVLAAYKSGNKLWSRTLDSPMESVMTFDNAGRLFFISKGNLYSVDTASGVITYEVALPAFLARVKSLPPKLEVQDERVFVAGERGIAAYSTKTGKRLFEHFVEGAELFTHAYASRSMAMKHIPGGLKYNQVFVPTQQYVSSPSYYSTVQQYVNYVDWNTRSFVESSRRSTARDSTYATSGAMQRMSALDHNIAVKQWALAQQQSMAQMQLDTARMQLAMSLQQLAVAWRASNIGDRDKLYEMMVKRSYDSLNDSLQWGYYLRPWFQDGWGVTVIELATGKRADIRHSPYSEPLLIGSAQLPVVAIDPVNRRLIVKGLGLDQKKYVLYKKNGLSLEIPLFPYQWDIPYPSILAYDLDGISLDSKGSPSFIPRPGLNDKDRALVGAILEKNKEKVEEAIKSGANVNAQDEFGATPVFYSVLTDNRGINKLLMAKGADPVACDIGGQTPNTWTNYSVPAPRGSLSVITENNSRVEEVYGSLDMEKRHRACMKKWGQLK